MDSDTPAQVHARSRRGRPPGLNYKFQRLRERIRSAIVTGELSGKLPGERLLAKRFRANAKTLSKALTDLAAEGVLQRSIGRGTYVSGQLPPEPVQTRWLILADPGSGRELVTELLKLNPESRCLSVDDTLRPSMLAQCSVVINCSKSMPESLYHDLMVRGLPVVETARPATQYSTHAVVLDRHQAAFNLAREILLLGHVRLASVDVPGQSALFDAVNWAVTRYGPEASVRPASLDDIGEMVSQGTTAVVCDGARAAGRVLQVVDERRKFLGIHGGIAVCGVGTMGDHVTCTGYYVDPAGHAREVAEMLRTLQPHRPSIIWLTGTLADRGTLVPPRGCPVAGQSLVAVPQFADKGPSGPATSEGRLVCETPQD